MKLREFLNKIIGALVFGAFLMLIYCGMRLWICNLAESEHGQSYSSIQSQVTVLSPENVIEIGTPIFQPTIPLPEFAALVSDYPNFAGWISIYGTDLSLPVMQEEESNRNFYLSHDYQGIEDEFGCLYIPYYGSFNSDNVIIYGHNMRHEQMFGLLHRYQDPDFWENHRLINYDTPYQHKVYEVFSVMIVSVEDRHFRFQAFTVFSSPSQAHFFINECVERSLIETGVIPDDDSKLLTLVTCEYTIPNGNGRLVIVARDVTHYG